MNEALIHTGSSSVDARNVIEAEYIVLNEMLNTGSGVYVCLSGEKKH